MRTSAERARQGGVAARMALVASVVVALLLPAPSPGATHAKTSGASSGTTTSHAKPARIKPVLARPLLRPASVVVSGRAQARVLVHVQSRSSRGWRTVRSVRSDRHGRFSTRTGRPTGPQTLRALAQGRTSAVRTVVPPSDACGVQPVKPDGTPWRCTFHDDFTGTALDPDKWLPMETPGDASGLCYASSPETIAVRGGELRLATVATGGRTTCPALPDGSRGTYAAASVTSWHRFGQRYGRFEARMRSPEVDGPGLHDAFWLWPDTRTASDADWPNTGEIDVAECYSAYPDLVVPFLHYSADTRGPVEGLNTTTHAQAARGTWHTYTLTWTAGRLAIAVDGREVLVNTSGAASFRKAFILNLTQMLGSGKNAPAGTPDLGRPLEVDYVRVWK